VLDTGNRTARPPIPGLAGVPFITVEDWIALRALPAELIFLGGSARRAGPQLTPATSACSRSSPVCYPGAGKRDRRSAVAYGVSSSPSSAGGA
jgi:hypothetical protein